MHWTIFRCGNHSYYQRLLPLTNFWLSHLLYTYFFESPCSVGLVGIFREFLLKLTRTWVFIEGMKLLLHITLCPSIITVYKYMLSACHISKLFQLICPWQSCFLIVGSIVCLDWSSAWETKNNAQGNHKNDKKQNKK